MIKRLEQVAALVVAAGLAIVSYWLFFSWAQGGGAERRAEEPEPERRAQGRRLVQGANAEVAMSYHVSTSQKIETMPPQIRAEASIRGRQP